MRQRQPGAAPDMRTLDDPEPEISQQIVAGAIMAHSFYAGDDWVLSFDQPNRWHRFWAWLLLGARWERGRTNSEIER